MQWGKWLDYNLISSFLKVHAGRHDNIKTSEAKDETIRLGDSTQSWSPMAKVRDLYTKEKDSTTTTNTIHSYINKPLLKSNSEEAFRRVPIRIDLISAFPQTEFNVCPTKTTVSFSERSSNQFGFDDSQPHDSLNDSPMRTVSSKWKGGIKQMKTSRIKSGSAELDFQSAMALTSQQQITESTGSVSVTGKDSENRDWILESDLHSVSLRFSLLFKDINKVPRNHLR